MTTYRSKEVREMKWIPVNERLPERVKHIEFDFDGLEGWYDWLKMKKALAGSKTLALAK